jgi:hypothetical protein
MRTLVVRAAIVAATAAGAGSLGCAGRVAETASAGAADASADAEAGTAFGATTGQVGVDLSISGDSSSIAYVAYTLSNGAHSYASALQVTSGSIVSFVIPGVAPGGGYTVEVDVTTTDGDGCTGLSGPLGVLPGQTTSATVLAACMTVISTRPPVPDPGTMCPIWNTIFANPPTAGRSPDDTSVVTVDAMGPDPAAITVAFSVVAGAGTIGDAKTVLGSSGDAVGTATFTCPPHSETDTIQIVVGLRTLPDGTVCPAAYTTGTVDVTCAGWVIEAGADASEGDH